MSVPTDSDALQALLRATRDFASLAERSAEATGLTLAQMRLLFTLHDLGLANCSAVAARLHVSVSSVTRLVARPAMSILVARRVSPVNASVVELALTQAGHAVVEAVTAARAERFGAALRNLPPAEQAALARGLAAVCHALGGGHDE